MRACMCVCVCVHVCVLSVGPGEVWGHRAAVGKGGAPAEAAPTPLLHVPSVQHLLHPKLSPLMDSWALDGGQNWGAVCKDRAGAPFTLFITIRSLWVPAVSLLTR